MVEELPDPEYLDDAFWCRNGGLCIKGTREPFPNVNKPSCKYTALFDNRPGFDALRLSFLVDADPNKLPYTFVSKLQALIEDRKSVSEM